MGWTVADVKILKRAVAEGHAFIVPWTIAELDAALAHMKKHRRRTIPRIKRIWRRA